MKKVKFGWSKEKFLPLLLTVVFCLLLVDLLLTSLSVKETSGQEVTKPFLITRTEDCKMLLTPEDIQILTDEQIETEIKYEKITNQGYCRYNYKITYPEEYYAPKSEVVALELIGPGEIPKLQPSYQYELSMARDAMRNHRESIQKGELERHSDLQIEPGIGDEAFSYAYTTEYKRGVTKNFEWVTIRENRTIYKLHFRIGSTLIYLETFPKFVPSRLIKQETAVTDEDWLEGISREELRAIAKMVASRLAKLIK